MDYVKSFKEGCEELVNSCDFENIGLVLIPSHSGNLWHESMKVMLTRSGIVIKPENTYYYTPPGDVGAKKWPRLEEVPEITNSNLTYIIIDKCFETGGTLNSVMGRLIESGVERNNLWFFSGDIFPYKPKNESPFLDKASSFLEYRLRNSI